MLFTTANEFRKNLKSSVDKCVNDHEIMKVQRRNGEDFIVISEKDWRAVEETLYLNQYVGMVNSIHKAAEEPLNEGTPVEDLDW